MTSKEALMLLLRAFLGDEVSKRKVNKNYDEIENQLLTDIYRLEELEKENQELKQKVKNFEYMLSNATPLPVDKLLDEEWLKKWNYTN